MRSYDHPVRSRLKLLTAFISDPEEAAEVLSEAPGLWSALVTDLHMEGIDGRALARHAGTLLSPVLVVLVTAGPYKLGDAPAPEFAALVFKPVTATRLPCTVCDAYARGSIDADD